MTVHLIKVNLPREFRRVWLYRHPFEVLAVILLRLGVRNAQKGHRQKTLSLNYKCKEKD